MSTIKEYGNSGGRYRGVAATVTMMGLIACGGTAHAAALLDFGIVAPTNSTLLPGPAASISYAGGGAALMGSNIEVDNVAGLNVPLHNNAVSTCVLCSVNFTSGAFDSYDAGSQTWTFSGGGAITVVGGVDFSDNTSIADIAPGTTLLTGSFTQASVTKLPTGFFDFRIAAGAFDDSKDAVLLSYYGLPDTAYEGGLNLSFAATPTAGNGFTSTAVYSGDIVNAPVPLPAAVWLLGGAVLSLLPLRRRPANV